MHKLEASQNLDVSLAFSILYITESGPLSKYIRKEKEKNVFRFNSLTALGRKKITSIPQTEKNEKTNFRSPIGWFLGCWVQRPGSSDPRPPGWTKRQKSGAPPRRLGREAAGSGREAPAAGPNPFDGSRPRCSGRSGGSELGPASCPRRSPGHCAPVLIRPGRNSAAAAEALGWAASIWPPPQVIYRIHRPGE